MSRIGKVPVVIPEKVEVKVNGAHVAVKGPNGQLEYTFTNKVTIALEGKEVKVGPVDESKESRSLWGTTRTLISNMVVGVSKGFTRQLIFNGVGYKALVRGENIILNLGFSHPIDYVLPKGVQAKVTKNVIDLSGCDKELVGFAAAKIRSFRPPEPYKGKGVKYAEETIIRKAGKAGSK
ncbi:50S ribosomal protein L6 [Halobacteriovorax marinus]|uniref:Large ribosomal subunit protein uL6 n=1 Tax=Halobacteriovorax marinus TaxID=97084 RepID=A0A1Y5F3D7_9BACT|nr:50S ribosomal protein L6 [Halobacteriovorax marinus]